MHLVIPFFLDFLIDYCIILDFVSIDYLLYYGSNKVNPLSFVRLDVQLTCMRPHRSSYLSGWYLIATWSTDY
jgi:hypothetical protein